MGDAQSPEWSQIGQIGSRLLKTAATHDPLMSASKITIPYQAVGIH